MAENKDSFIAYCEWEKRLEFLTDEESGKLFKHILAYVSDRNPEFGENERILKVAFEPIKQQLKRDLKSYEETKEKNSINGRLGNLKKYQKDLYSEVIGKKITLEEAETIAVNRKTSPPDIKTSPPDEPRPENVAILADNVNGNDNGNGNDIKLKGLVPPPPKIQDELFSGEEVKKPILEEKEKSSAKKEKEIVDYFHEKCKRLPKVLIINQNRKKAIKARIHDFGIEKINEMFDMVSESNFLNGENPRTWSADFDWIMKPANFTKILEGNYANKTYNSKDNINGEFETNR